MLKYRFLSRFLPKSTTKRLTILTGARQTGKTTLIKRHYPELRYISLDPPENREAIRGISTFLWSRDVGNAIIDEAQKEPTLFEKIKYAYDQGGITFSLLSGSSQILLLKKIRETLAGRVSIFEIWPLMMSELAHEYQASKVPPPLFEALITSSESCKSILKRLPSILIGEKDAIGRDVENYILQWGGMPALLNLTADERWKWLKDYEYTYLERDLADLSRLNDLEPFRKFQKLAALRSGNLLNYSEIARDGSISVDTARRYLEYLKISYQVILIPPYYKNITSSVIKTPKLYWLDIGLLRHLSGHREGLTGQLFETMVVSEIVKWIRTTQIDTEIYFYRTRSGLELDLLLETVHGFIGIEIKARKRLVESDLRAMKDVAQGLGKAWKGGLVVYLGDEIKPLSSPHIWAIPSRRLLG